MQRFVILALAQAIIPAVMLAQATAFPQPPTPTKPSLLRVLANPQAYDKQEIQVIGFLSMGFENTALFLHKEDLAYNLFCNAVWVDTDSLAFNSKRKLNKKYVLIRGKFFANETGHMGLYSGTITDVSRCDILADPEHPLWGGPPPPAPNSIPR